ncbi:MAG: hypothetical protein ACRDPY_10435 [Streptosporangiaceae bacterium]
MASPSNTAAPAATHNATGTARACGAARSPWATPEDDSKRARRKVSGQTKAVVVDKLRDLHLKLDKGITPKAGYAHYTVRQNERDVQIRLHTTALYNSIYHADDQLLVNQHTCGIPAAHAPVFCLRRIKNGEMAAVYLDSFQHVWTSGVPLA